MKAGIMNENFEGIFSTNAWKSVALQIIKRDGIVKMPSLTTEQVTEFVNYLHDKPVVNAHVQAKATLPSASLSTALKIREWPMMCHTMNDIVSAPYFFELAVSMLDFVKQYFDDETPKLYSMNGFWTQPASGEQYLDTHWWHRDGDDRKQLALFLFGTDVLKTQDGAHLYQKGTHRIPDTALPDGKGGLRHYEKPPYECLVTMVGAAGTVFASDPGGLHMGLRPTLVEGERHKTRLLVWARYGVSDMPASYQWDRMHPVPKAVLGARYPKNPQICNQIKLVVS